MNALNDDTSKSAIGRTLQGDGSTLPPETSSIVRAEVLAGAAVPLPLSAPEHRTAWSPGASYFASPGAVASCSLNQGKRARRGGVVKRRRISRWGVPLGLGRLLTCEQRAPRATDS